MNTNRTYADGLPVPFPPYRCRATAKVKSELHKCKQHTDHDGDHKCICNKTWPPKVDGQ